MKGASASPDFCLGFLTVVEHAEQGLFGGYLLLNRAGRPLEFHCTTPLKPNRAQQILYGPTLESYLYGEQIGQVLVTKPRLAPLAVCTDCEPALSVRDFTDCPVALVLSAERTGAATDSAGDTLPAAGGRMYRIEGGHHRGQSGPAFLLGRNRLAVAADAPADRDAITERLADWAESFDLAEPFQRIREAIEEARRGGQ